MEEYDDLSKGPTQDGSFNLSSMQWKLFPTELVNYSKTLLHLDMSNNQLTSIPSEIGNLALLKSLDMSLNQIESIDGGVGKCIRLRRLNVAKNRIKILPVEIGQCRLLEEILASDNQLCCLPQDLLRLIVISVIDVRNNRLGTLPTELSRMPTLTQLLCDGNSQLASAPENMRGDSDLLIGCLEMVTRFDDVIRPKETYHNELQDQSHQLDNKLSQKRHRIGELERDITFLEWERPNRYIHRKRQFLMFTWRVRAKFMHLLRLGKGGFSKRIWPNS